MRLAFGSVVVASGLLAVAHGCSSPSGATAGAADAGSDAELTPEATVGDATHCVIPPKPAAVPEGWDLYTDYDPCCLLYAPTAPQYLPPPLQWTSCSAAWKADGGVCRMLDQPSAGSPTLSASVHNGVVSLLTTELVGSVYAHVVADADGPVHQAMMQASGSCGPSPQDMRDGKYVFQIYNVDTFNGGGFLAGDVDEFRPSFVHHFNDAITHGVVVGQLGVLDVDETDALTLYRWDQSSKVISNPQDVGLEKSFPFFSADALFWGATTSTTLRVAGYTDGNGATDLLSFGADWSHGAGDLGSDGKDMVWIEGSGRAGPLSDFDSGSFMTSTFTTDPSHVVKRRLRSEDSKGMSASPTTVGCGYAARSSIDGSGHVNGIRIVRISDGVSWSLVSNTTAPWIWIHPLALTCDELFAAVGTGPDTNNVARVQISSLGPGVPAD